VYHYAVAESGFLRVQVAGVNAHVQRLVSVVKIVTVLEEYTTGQQQSVVCFL
jgi:hypothetical protein